MQDWKYALDQTIHIAQHFLSEEEKVPVLPYQSPSEASQSLPLRLEEKGLSEAEFFACLEALVMQTPKTASTGFFNQLWGGRNLAATAGEILAAILNSSMYTYKVAGPQVLVEMEVVRKMLEKVGFSEGEGAFAPGGSMANFTAMLVARNEFQPELRQKGFAGPTLIAYTSVEGHYSTTKNAGMLGLGRENVRLVPVDGLGKMRPEALATMIEEDRRAGHRPFFVNATAGTTVLGMYDPFEALAQVCCPQGIWLHIDGAFGGSALLSRQYRHLLKGCEQADSFAWNAHKMMGVPLTASVVLFQQKGMLRKHLSEKAEYLYQGEDDYNPGEYSLQCGRRNDALKVWAAWKYYGDEGYEARVNRQFALSQYAARQVEADPALELVQAPECLNVCFAVKGHSAKELCRELDEAGLLKVGYGRFGKREFIRMVCIDPDLEENDLDQFFVLVRRVAALA